MDLKKAKRRFTEIANKTGIHGDNIKQEPNMQERDELWDITRVFLNRIYILDEIDDLSEEEVKEYNDLCYWSISALHWNDSLENYTFDNGRHRRDTLTLALCLYARVNRDYKVYENIKENFVIPHAFGSILFWVCNEITTVGRDIYFEKFDLEFIKLANEQKKAFFIEYGYYNRADKELEQDKIEKIALEIYNILNQKRDKNLPQFLLKYIRNDKGLLAEDLEKNTKYLESILSSSTTTKEKINKIKSKEKIEKEDDYDSEKGYPAINVRVFKDENGEKDVETQKLVSQYMMYWQEKTEEYNGRMGITARIPDFFQEINKSCPKWSEQEIENICNYIEKYKVIPTLRYAPEEFDFYTKQVWWLAPFVLLNTNTGEIASWLFIDKNGFYAAHPSDNDGALIFNWDIITDIDIDYEDNLVMLTLTGEHNDNEITQTFTEFISDTNGSYLSVIPKIYEAYKKTIEVSDNTWFHGAGGEGYHGFDNAKELLNEEIWKGVKPTNPAIYGYAPPKLESEKNGEHIKYDSGISYQGEAKEDEKGNRIPHGKGVMTVPDGPVITGDFKEGLADGYAKMDFLDGEVYEGEFKENKKHGKGIYVWPNGNKYEGEYQKGNMHGHGIYTWSSGETWEGEWEDDNKDGSGIYSYADGAKFTSDWRDDKWSKVTMVDFDENDNEIKEVKKSKYLSSKGFVFYGKYNDDQQRTTEGTITTPNGLEINLKDCEKYVDKDLTESYTEMRNTYGSHTFEYDDTSNGILSFERVSEIFGDCSNEEELSYETDRVYGIKITNDLDGYVILHAQDNEIKEALEEERDVESAVIIKSDNIAFVTTLVEILKLNNREVYEGESNEIWQADILEFDKEFKEEETIEEKKKMKNNYVFEDWPVKLCLEKFDSAKIKLKDEFDKKYPELKGRFEVLNKELIFTISKESEIHEHNWSVDFLESNVNEGRPYNGLGRKLSKEIYTDLFQLFCDDGDVFFASSNDNCIVETVGEFDSRCSFKLKNDGLHWEEEEEEEDWDDEEVKEEEKKEVNKEFWWDEINDYVINKIKQENESIDEYLGHLQILFIDEWDVEDEVEGAMRYHNKVTFEDLDKLEPWIGKEEVKKWKMDWESLSVEEKKNTHETALYMSTDEGYEYLTHLTIDKENFIEQLDIDTEEVREEIAIKDDIDSIQSFRSFMKEKFPSLKLPKNKPYAGIDLKDGYSINFHVQKKAVVLSFRSVKTDPEEIMRILNEKELNGKDIGDGHILNAEPGKRNPSIITMNIEITYSSEDELASDALRENVRSYFEKFSELFDLNK